MLKVDLDRILRPNALIYLLTFVPGLFFLAAVGVANPDLSSRLATRLQAAIPFGYYTTLFVALFLAFLIGATFVTLVSLIQHVVLGLAWHLWFSLKPFLYKHAVLPLLVRLLAGPPPAPNTPAPKPKPKWLLDLHRKMVDKVFPGNPAEEPAFLWWDALVRQLFRTRFGMQEKDLPATSLQPLVVALVGIGFWLQPRTDVFYIRTTVWRLDPDHNPLCEHEQLAVKVELARLWLLFVPTALAVAFLVVTAAHGTLWRVSLLDWIENGYALLIVDRTSTFPRCGSVVHLDQRAMGS
jgi:hypothetical protein